MAKVRTSLLLFLSVLVAVAVGISLLLKVYLPRPEAVARLSQLLSRSFGLEIAIERVAVPWGWTGLGSVVLHDVAVSGPRVDGEGNTPLFRAQSMELRPSFLPLIWGELKLRWIEVEGPELRFEGRPLKACDVAFAYLQQALEGWTDLARGAHRLPVERLTLKKGVLSMAGVRLTDVEFRVEGWGSPTPHVHLSGELTVSGGSLPFQAGVQVSSPSELPSSTSTTAGWPGSGRSPFHMAAWIRFERVPLAPLQPLVPILDLKASRATALLTLVVSSEKEVEGALEARTEEVFIQGGKEPWESTLRARFRVEPAKGEASVSDVFLTAPGVQAKGVGKAGCSGEGVSYAIQMKDLVLILAELGGKVPGFAEAVGGRVAVQAFEAAGVWPDRPAELKLDGLVEEMGPFAFRSVRLLAISGQWQVEGGLDRLKAKAVLNAKAEGVGRAEVIHMALNGTIQGNLWKGDFTLEPMRVQIDPLGKSNLVVRLKEWGRATAELAAGPIELDLTELNHLVASLQGGLKVEALESPSLRLTRKAGQASWEAWMEFRTISLHTSGYPMTLLGTTVKLFSRGIRGIEGTLLGKALSLSGHDLEGLTLTFALHEGRLTFKDFKASAYGGEVEGAGTFVPSIAEGNLRLHIRRLHLGRLLAQLETRQGLPLPIPSQSQASPLPMSAEVSLGMNRHGLSFRLKTQPFEAAEAATFTLGTTSQLPVKLLSGAISAEVVGTLEGGGPKFSGTLSLEKVGVHPTWQRGQPLTFSFDIPFAFEDGLLEVPEFSLTVGDQVHIFLAGALSVGSKAGRVRSLAFRLPLTETSSLQKAIAGLLPGALPDTHLSGGLEARVEMLGDQVQGEVRLEGVGTEGGIMTLKGVSGRIPLFQRLGVSSVVTGDGWPELSEQAFEVALQAVRQPSSSPSLTISSLSYAGFELEDLAVHFSSRAGPLAIDHFSFQGLGGSGRGRGVVEPFGGSLHLALLVEGLSLREICSRFPSIEGYIFGKVRGMLELSLPIFEPSQAIGRARFWAVKSEEEPRKVSKALIERLGGQSGGFSSLIALRGDRSYDHGLLEVTLKDRLLTFHNLEISNTVLFIKDLDIKVVPAYNTIAIQDLFDTIQETWKRVQP